MLAMAAVVGSLSWGAAISNAPWTAPWTWEAPAAVCPTSADVQGSIERYAGRPLERSEVGARGKVLAVEDGGYRLELTLFRAGVDGESITILDPDCTVLAEAAALKVATAMLERASAQPLPLPEPQPPTRPAVAPMAPPRCRPGRSRMRESPSVLTPECGLLQLGSIAQWGPLPGVSGGLAAEAGLLWRRVRLQAGARFWFPRVHREGTREATFRMLVGAALVCPRLGAGSFEFPLCAGVEVGSLHGAGTGVANPRIDRLVWVAGLLRGAVAWAPHPRVALFVLGELAIPLADYRFELARAPIHDPSPVGGRVGGGVELRLFTRSEKSP